MDRVSHDFSLQNSKEINAHIKRSLSEDSVNNDITTKLLFSDIKKRKIIVANLVCKEKCVLAGLEMFKKVFKFIDQEVSFKIFHSDGDKISDGTIVLKARGNVISLLKGERTALNYLQRMSGIATLTNEFVKKLRYKNAKILHTRKTTPNFRLFEVDAVRIGGGHFHRLNLASSVMIKDNHIDALNGIRETLNIVRSKRLSSKQKHKFEVEVKSLSELNHLIENNYGWVRIVMLDNFPKYKIRKAINLLKKHRIKIELSGKINLNNFSSLQYPGIDYYSIGMLTHGYRSIDFSLDF